MSMMSLGINREGAAYVIAGALGVAAAGVGVFLIRRKHKETEGSKLYETEKLVNEYLGFHYCPPKEYMAYDFGPEGALDFPKRCTDLCLRYKNAWVLSRAIDIGCAVGRSTFELAREFDEVIGVDFSHAFVAKCQEMKITGQAKYSLTVEGDLVEKKMATIDPAIDRSRVSFTVADACNLPDLGKFGCVFAGNLICRLPEPMGFFNRLSDMIVPGGILFITSPYTWLKSYTEKEKWLGGYMKDGEEVRGFSTLKQILEPNFELLADQDFPFLIRETVRKHQWTVAHVTIWKRK